MKTFDSLQGFIFDLDGTIYLGDAALPGAVETISYLRKYNRRVLFVTNKPLQPRRVYAQKLSSLGIPATADDIITSGYVMGYYLAVNMPDLRLYVLGEEPLIAELRSQGLKIVADDLALDPMGVIDPDGIDAVVVAFDRTLDYRKLNTAYQALTRGARFFATNSDRVCPMPGGAIPDAGATIAALTLLTGREVEFLAGKPSSAITDVILQRLSLRAEECLMVGDRLETDIALGQAAGMRTAVVLTGVSSRSDVELMGVPPDLVLEHVGMLPGVLTCG